MDEYSNKLFKKFIEFTHISDLFHILLARLRDDASNIFFLFGTVLNKYTFGQYNSNYRIESVDLNRILRKKCKNGNSFSCLKITILRNYHITIKTIIWLSSTRCFFLFYRSSDWMISNGGKWDSLQEAFKSWCRLIEYSVLIIGHFYVQFSFFFGFFSGKKPQSLCSK